MSKFEWDAKSTRFGEDLECLTHAKKVNRYGVCQSDFGAEVTECPIGSRGSKMTRHSLVREIFRFNLRQMILKHQECIH
jgi:hypothetical protein